MSGLLRRGSTLAVLSLVSGVLAGSLLYVPPEPYAPAGIAPLEWIVPRVGDDQKILDAVAMLTELDPWGERALVQSEPSPEELAEREAAEAAARARAERAARRAEAEARRLAAEWRFLGSVRARDQRIALFLSGSGELRRILEGESLVDEFKVAELHRDRVMLIWTSEEENESPTIRLELFRNNTFEHTVVESGL